MVLIKCPQDRLCVTEEKAEATGNRKNKKELSGKCQRSLSQDVKALGRTEWYHYTRVNVYDII